MPKILWISPIAATLLTGCMSVNTRDDVPAQALTPQQIVAARQASFHLSAVTMGNLKAAIDRGAEPSSQAFAARGVARWAEVLPTMFPESTATVTPTRARPEIWAGKADFNTKAASFAAAANGMAQAAQGNNKEAFAAEWRATNDSCASCHTSYQAPRA